MGEGTDYLGCCCIWIALLNFKTLMLGSLISLMERLAERSWMVFISNWLDYWWFDIWLIEENCDPVSPLGYFSDFTKYFWISYISNDVFNLIRLSSVNMFTKKIIFLPTSMYRKDLSFEPVFDRVQENFISSRFAVYMTTTRGSGILMIRWQGRSCSIWRFRL